MNKKFYSKIFCAAMICPLIALPSFALASRGDHVYDQYAAQQNAAVLAPRAQAVIIGDKAQYLDRSGLFIYVINDEINDNDHRYRHGGVETNTAIQNDWLAFCRTKNADGTTILPDDELIAYARKCGKATLYLCPTNNITYSEGQKFDDGRLKTKYYASQQFIAVLADGSQIIDRINLSVRGDSSKSRDRALVDAFEEGVEQAEIMLYRLKR